MSKKDFFLRWDKILILKSKAVDRQETQFSLSGHISDEQRERMTTEKSLLMHNHFFSANAWGEIYTFCLFVGRKIPQFLQFRVVVFNLPRGSFPHGGVMKFPFKKWLFISQVGVENRLELLLLSWESLIRFSWMHGRQESPRLRAPSLNSARPRLEGWFCPSLVLEPWASCWMTPSFCICRVERLLLLLFSS